MRTRLRTLVDGRYRRGVRLARLVVVTVGATSSLSFATAGCESIDPGPDYVVPLVEYNASYFYCELEPNLIFAKGCGDDGSHGCHFSNKVPALVLYDHPPVTCVNGQPSDPTQIGMGTYPTDNLAAVSIQMDPDYLNAPIYTWPTQIVSAHPKQVFLPSDPVVQYIATWAQQ